MKDYVIFDLDGCLADDEWRRHYLPPEGTTDPGKYADYHRRCTFDSPMNLALFKRMSSGIMPIFVTARSTAYEALTRHWIETVLGCPDYLLRMRHESSRFNSPDFKSEVAKRFLDIGGNIVAAFDDRIDVLEAYFALGIKTAYQLNKAGLGVKIMPKTAADCLKEGETLFRERNGAYKDSPQRFGNAMAALYPEGLTLKGADDFTKFGIFLQMMSKTTRFAASDNKHLDSIRDLKVYAAMLEAEMGEPHDDK